MQGRSSPLRVLARPAFSNALNPYNARIYGGIQAHGVEVVEYTAARALTERFDLVHVHWPESSFNHSLTGARLTTRTLLAGIAAQRRRGARLVWTVHNLQAHERRHPGPEARFWGRFLPQVDALIALSEASLARAKAARPALAGKPAFIVPHPHYRGCYPDQLSRAQARQQLGLAEDRPVITFFGQLKRYKQVPALIAAVRALPEVQLLVAGKLIDGALQDELQRAAGDDPRVRLDFGFVPADKTQLYLRAADLIALPYRDILNSGTALLGLSFDRPVWLPEAGPAGALAAELRQQIGPQWVHSGPLSPASLRAALQAAASLPERSQLEHMTRFSPEAVVAQTAQAFHQIAGQT